MLSSTIWNEVIDQFFECPGKKGVYILGCFATNVTLYTQQVRAFNLIAGLQQTGRLKPGQHVAVIGAGAAGLSAAAAAAHLGYEVYLFEKGEGPLELQLNNRQRWIHPYIYDWPEKKVTDREAKLPLLNWEAAYAESVAAQIIDGWNSLKQKVKVMYGVPELNIFDGSAKQGRISISRSDRPTTKYYVDHLIMAVGFGIEQGPHCQSYWAEDDFDFGFHRQDEKWLISGRGDGALTDLMRLCIKRFRHEEILSIFSTVEGIETIMEELKDLELRSAFEGQPLSEEELSDQFCEKVKNLKLRGRLEKRFRNSGPHVTLVAKKHAICGGKSSVLNRLIAAILGEDHSEERPDDLPRFHFHVGEVDPECITREGPVFKVLFKGDTDPHEFHRVILRHGPPKFFVSKLLRAEYDLDRLRVAWETRKGADLTAEPHWERGITFGPETKPAREDSQSTKGDHRAGVRLRGLTFQEDVKGDGSSILTYVLDGLSVLKGGEPVSKVRFRFKSASGMFGEPRLDDECVRQGYVWVPDAPLPNDLSLNPVDRAVAQRRVAFGAVVFPVPLEPDAPPISFSLSAVAINSDALTLWELEHLYTSEDAKDLDDTPLHDSDYVARIVYFPVDTLTTRVNLPEIPGLEAPEVSFFRRTSHDRGGTPHTLVKDGEVHLSPPPDSADWLSDGKWVPQNISRLGGSATVISRPYSVELKVSDPHVGDAFKVAWKVSRGPSDSGFDKLIGSAAALRDDLVSYAAWRRDSRSPAKLAFNEIGKLFREVYADLSQAQEHLSSLQPFQIGLMTLNHVSKRIEYVDGVDTEGNLMKELDSFSLPFGAGLSGSCFKRPDRAYIYHPDYPPKPGWPEYYLSVEGRNRPKSVISIGLDHPQWYQGLTDKGCERSRQCIAVLDISTPTDGTWFRAIASDDPTEVRRLMDVTQKFGDKVAKAFGY